MQSHFPIIQNPCKLWQMATIYDIMITCVIPHNMIIEDERNINLESLFDQANVFNQKGLTFQAYIEGAKQLQNLQIHYKL